MRRHRFDILSFVSGLVFAGAGIAYLVNDGRWRFDAGPWVWPLVLLVGGTVVLLSTILDERRSRPLAATDPGSAAEADLDAGTVVEVEPEDPVL